MVFAESTLIENWGTGLNKVETENTNEQAWTEKNAQGQILSKLAKKALKRKKGDQWSSPQQRRIAKQSSKQRDIADSVFGRDVSFKTDKEEEEEA